MCVISNKEKMVFTKVKFNIHGGPLSWCCGVPPRSLPSGWSPCSPGTPSADCLWLTPETCLLPMIMPLSGGSWHPVVSWYRVKYPNPLPWFGMSLKNYLCFWSLCGICRTQATGDDSSISPPAQPCCLYPEGAAPKSMSQSTFGVPASESHSLFSGEPNPRYPLI